MRAIIHKDETDCREHGWGANAPLGCWRGGDFYCPDLQQIDEQGVPIGTKGLRFRAKEGDLILCRTAVVVHMTLPFVGELIYSWLSLILEADMERSRNQDRFRNLLERFHGVVRP